MCYTIELIILVNLPNQDAPKQYTIADMRASIENTVLFLHHEDLPKFKKGGSVVRNSYFWALRSIAGRTSRYRDAEIEKCLASFEPQILDEPQ